MVECEEEQALIQRARDGDHCALEQLLVGHSVELAAYIARRLPAWLRPHASTEDVMQHALVEAFLKIRRLRDTSPRAFSAWLNAVAEMSLLAFQKTHRRLKRGGRFHRMVGRTNRVTGSVLELLDHLPDEAVTASSKIARQEAAAALHVGIASLAEDQRRAIELHLLEGKSLQETAAVIKRSPAAVRGLVYRGKHKLAELMGNASSWLSSR
jgi:RNA polymerase sigma factor (sigma-70 family)